ncbi:ash family protein [Glaesserella parasuis]|uniref:ash family protein n=1 Tax=Glaesserella parasuis TaxID=738 RepID=UPI003B67A22A
MTSKNNSPYAIHVFAKSEAERQNSNRHMANNSTPLTRAFFIRCTRTPKENALSVLLSMVACSGKGFALCCVPYVAVSDPVARYRPITVRSEAIAPINLHMELSAMKRFAFTYVCVLRNTDTYTTQTVRLIANSETEARLQLPADYRLELDRPIAKIRLNPTACDQTKGGIYA